MKRYIVDANVIFSALISGREEYLRMFTEFEMLIPDFALTEMQVHQTRILADARIEMDTFRSFTLQVFRHVTVIPNMLISNRSYLAAWQLCRDIDEKDTAYLAAAIEFDVELVSKDAKLVDGLQQKGFTKIISLKRFFEILEENN
jgi:predicted nucleic acid-binding protein